MPIINAEFPEKFQCLFQPARYKVLHGGRGGAKTWSVAKALLLMGYEKPISVLCAREFQNSIDESVHKVLCEKIVEMGLENFYTIEKVKIYGANGTEFSFAGIKNNPRKIKGYASIDICWVEEAANVSAESWKFLRPTIRQTKPQHNTPSGKPEIWVTFNADLESDCTYQQFVLHPPSSAIVVKVGHQDNPWFTDDLRQEMEDMKAADYDEYLNIWEGLPRQILTGAVYAKELRKAQEEDRLTTPVPYSKLVPVSTYWDLGKSDFTAVWFVQFVNFEIRVIDYYANQGFDVDHYIQEVQKRGYSYAEHFLPHDAKHDRLGQKRTVEQQIRSKLGNTKIIPIGRIFNGIAAVRQIFPQCWFDPVKCQDGLQALRHYRYKVTDGQYSRDPEHTWASHGADAFRGVATSIKLDKPRVGDKLINRIKAAKAHGMLPRISDGFNNLWMK